VCRNTLTESNLPGTEVKRNFMKGGGYLILAEICGYWISNDI